MNRTAIGVVCCAVGGAVAAPAVAVAPPPPPPPKPVSLTITKVRRHLVVVVRCHHMTSQNSHGSTDLLALDVRTITPKGEYGVQSNGPGMPEAVHPYGGNGSSSGPAKLRISVKHQTETFTFGLRAIKNPHLVKIRALSQGSGHTKFYSLRLRS